MRKVCGENRVSGWFPEICMILSFGQDGRLGRFFSSSQQVEEWHGTVIWVQIISFVVASSAPSICATNRHGKWQTVPTRVDCPWFSKMLLKLLIPFMWIWGIKVLFFCYLGRRINPFWEIDTQLQALSPDVLKQFNAPNAALVNANWRHTTSQTYSLTPCNCFILVSINENQTKQDWKATGYGPVGLRQLRCPCNMESQETGARELSRSHKHY